MRKPWCLALVPLLVLVGTSTGQVAPSPARPVATPDVVVRGRSTPEKDIAALTSAPNGTQIARWHDDLCLAMAGVDEEHAGFIVSRMAATAQLVGIKVGQASCAANVLIVFSANSDAFTRDLVAKHPGLFHDPQYGVSHPAETKALLVPRPVRWMNVARTGAANGLQLIGGTIAKTYGGGSLLHQAFRQNSVLSYIIVDDNRLDHITWAQLSDFLSFVALARPALDAKVTGSILSIFAARDAGDSGPPSLTEYDIDFLRSFYRSDPAVTAAQERSQIRSDMKATHADRR